MIMEVAHWDMFPQRQHQQREEALDEPPQQLMAGGGLMPHIAWAIFHIEFLKEP